MIFLSFILEAPTFSKIRISGLSIRSLFLEKKEHMAILWMKSLSKKLEANNTNSTPTITWNRQVIEKNNSIKLLREKMSNDLFNIILFLMFLFSMKNQKNLYSIAFKQLSYFSWIMKMNRLELNKISWMQWSNSRTIINSWFHVWLMNYFSLP